MGANTDPTQAAPNELAIDIGALIADTNTSAPISSLSFIGETEGAWDHL
jgi:hypothetical protein